MFLKKKKITETDPRDPKKIKCATNLWDKTIKVHKYGQAIIS